MTSDRARVHLHIRGLVQGVYFRASTHDEARRLGLCGWVRNEPDGSVTAVAEGPRAALEALVAWSHDGPPSAAVEEVQATWSEATDEFDAFVVRRDGA